MNVNRVSEVCTVKDMLSRKSALMACFSMQSIMIYIYFCCTITFIFLVLSNAFCVPFF